MTEFHLLFGEPQDFTFKEGILRLHLGNKVYLSCDASELKEIHTCSIYLKLEGVEKDAEPKQPPVERIYEVTPDGGLQERQDRGSGESGEGGV